MPNAHYTHLTHLTTLKPKHADSLTLTLSTHTSQHSNLNTLKHSHLAPSLTLKTHTHLTIYTQTQTCLTLTLTLTSRHPLQVSNRSSQQITQNSHRFGLSHSLNPNTLKPHWFGLSLFKPTLTLQTSRHSDSSHSLFKPRANHSTSSLFKPSLSLKPHATAQPHHS